MVEEATSSGAVPSSLASSAEERLSLALARVAAASGIVCAYLYGSRARDDHRRESDYDIGVFLASPPGSAEEGGRLELRLGGDLERAAGVGPVDVRVLDGAPLRVRGAVLTYGRLLFSGDERRRVAIERDTRIAYLECRERLRSVDREILAGIAEHGLRHGRAPRNEPGDTISHMATRRAH